MPRACVYRCWMSPKRSSPPHVLDAFCRGAYPRIVGAMTIYCGSREIAEEIAQEALIRVCRNWSRVSRLDNPTAWTNRVAINLANSHFRRRALERRVQTRLKSGTQDASAADYEAVELRRLIAALPRRERMALVLRHYLELPVAEAADVMGCPEGTVKRLTHMAISRLRNQTKGDNSLREVTDVP
jgi:RNA polymerase sigma factor (sigma-70 family)